MAKMTISRLASHMISLSVMNDVVLFGSGTLFTWAKLLFLFSCIILLKGKISIRPLSKIDLVVILFCFTSVVFSVLFSGGGVGERFYTIAFSFTLGAIFYLILTRSSLKYDDLVNTFIFWTAVSSVLALFQAFLGWGFFSDRIFLSTIIPGTYRASGFMVDPNYFALICLLGIALCLGLRNKKTYLLVCIIGLFLSGSRSGVITLILILFVHKVKFRFSVLFLFKAIICLFFTFFVMYIFKEYLPTSLSMIFEIDSYASDLERNSLSDRTLAIKAGFSAFTENPIFGYGIGNLTSHPLNLHNQMSHNTIVEILSENGLVGFIVYMTVVTFMFKAAGSVVPINGVYNKLLINVLIVTQMMSMTIVIHYSRIMFFVYALVVMVCIKVEEENNLG